MWKLPSSPIPSTSCLLDPRMIIGSVRSETNILLESRHPGACRDPVDSVASWIPACDGMTGTIVSGRALCSTLPEIALQTEEVTSLCSIAHTSTGWTPISPTTSYGGYIHFECFPQLASLFHMPYVVIENVS